MPNRLASLRAPAFLLVVTALGVGCGDDDPAAAGGAAAEPTPASPLAAKLAACPVVQTSEDPAASACLEGTYEGETLAGEACTLVVRAGGAYDFASPALVVSSAPQDRTIRVFSHAERSARTVAWRLAEALQTGTSHGRIRRTVRREHARRGLRRSTSR